VSIKPFPRELLSFLEIREDDRKKTSLRPNSSSDALLSDKSNNMGGRAASAFGVKGTGSSGEDSHDSENEPASANTKKSRGSAKKSSSEKTTDAALPVRSRVRDSKQNDGYDARDDNYDTQISSADEKIKQSLRSIAITSFIVGSVVYLACVLIGLIDVSGMSTGIVSH
jgi:cobalamin biosynthesis Mg chelatase CobN